MPYASRVIELAKVELQTLKGYKGSVIVRTLYSNGKIICNKMIKTEY